MGLSGLVCIFSSTDSNVMFIFSLQLSNYVYLSFLFWYTFDVSNERCLLCALCYDYIFIYYYYIEQGFDRRGNSLMMTKVDIFHM